MESMYSSSSLLGVMPNLDVDHTRTGPEPPDCLTCLPIDVDTPCLQAQAVGDARGAPVFALGILNSLLDAVDDHLQVQLAHAGQDGVAGFRVAEMARKARVLAGERGEHVAQLVAVAAALRLDRHRDDGVGEVHRLEQDRLVLGAERVARGRLLEAQARDDLAGARGVDRLLLISGRLRS